jgi:2-(1,2-epoxy-1,2-dihydrophenyl)acetyl-CoA isomerase
MAPSVEYSLSGGIGCIHLNRPERLNAVTPTLVDDLVTAFDQAQSDDAQAVVLAGRGTSFCAGWDLKEPPIEETHDEARVRLQRLQDVTRRATDFPGPIIAAVHGYALGAGAEFALSADLVVAGADAVFGFPEVGVGLSGTNGSSYLLPRAIGLARAKELVFLGERFDAERAHAMGLVMRVVPPGAHEVAAFELAERLLTKPPVALQIAKQLLDHGHQSTLAQALDAEVDAALNTLDTDENADAAARFNRR